MKCLTKKFLVILLLSAQLFVAVPLIHAETDEERLARLSAEISKYESEVQRLSAEANTLANLIAQFNAQIRLTELKISQTEEKIFLLGGRIEQLEGSLNALQLAYTQRVAKTYKMSRFTESYLLFISLNNIQDAINSFSYLKRLQAADIDLLKRLEKAKSEYKEEKSGQEELQKELEVQKQSLSSQKNQKARLMEQTKNDEKKFQALLTAARAEFEAIQAIIAGKGQEEFVRNVSEGERIASIISGASCNSSGGHLHFMTVDGNTVNNPANYLSGKGVTWDNSPDGPFSFTGSFQWPMNDSIRITQGYGWTYYANIGYYRDRSGVKHPHSGIDMVSTDHTVKSVRAGKLYRGSYAIGCTLRYVRVDHDDSNIDTYYLHINY